MKLLSTVISLAATGLLGGCATVPADLGRSDVDALVTERGQSIDAATPATVAQLVEQLLREPLNAENAVRIALLNNPQLQATYASLAYGAADVYAAGRIRNPVFSGAWLNSDVPGDSSLVTLGIATSFADLITLPARKRLATAAFAALKQAVGAEVLAVAADSERAWYGYVGAQQVAALRAQIAKAGKLSATLAERFHDAGNMTDRELALERAAASEARLAALRAEAEAYAARTELANVLGLNVGEGWTAPTRLGVPPDSEDELGNLITLARNSRLDLAAARSQADMLADRLGVTHWSRWIGELDAGVEREREPDGAKELGPTVAWELPVFTQHNDALLRAGADLNIAIAEVARLNVGVENDVRLAYADLQNARARVVEYSEGLIPQRIESVARAQEQVNFMLIGIFELVALKQQEYDAYQGYLEAIRDYWLARTDLGFAVGNALPSSATLQERRIDVQDFIRPASGGMDHSGHQPSDKANDNQTLDDQSQTNDDPNASTDHQHHNGETS